MSNPFFGEESDVTQRLIWQHENIMSRCSIAKVTTINVSPVSVNIQPLVNYFDPISQWETYPILQNIPVTQMQNAVYSINTPLNIGDIGLVLWFDREVYTTLLNGATAPLTPDSGNLSDTNACVFIPMMQPFALSNPLMQSGVDFISSQVSLMTELLTLLMNLTTLLTSLTSFSTSLIAAGTPYAGSPSMPVVGAYPIAVTAAASVLNTAISTISSSIATITSLLTTFKGSQP